MMTMRGTAAALIFSLTACMHAAAGDSLLDLANARLSSASGAALATGEDFLMIDEDGTIRRSPGDHTSRGTAFEEPIVRYFDDAAIVAGKAGLSRTLQVWTRQGTAWRIVAEQWTSIALGDYVRHPSATPEEEPSPPDVKGEDTAAVLAAERIYREWVDLGKSRDAIRSSEYVGIVRDGQLETATVRVVRSSNPTKARSGVLQLEHDLRVRVYGRLGIVTGFVFNEGERVRFLRAYAREESGWKLVAGQSTTIVPR